MLVSEIRDIANWCRGQRLDVARARIVENGLLVRVISLDGIQFGGTADHVPGRINLDVIDGIVVDSSVG